MSTTECSRIVSRLTRSPDGIHKLVNISAEKSGQPWRCQLRKTQMDDDVSLNSKNENKDKYEWPVCRFFPLSLRWYCSNIKLSLVLQLPNVNAAWTPVNTCQMSKWTVSCCCCMLSILQRNRRCFLSPLWVSRLRVDNQAFIVVKFRSLENASSLRGAWVYRCFPAPFSWFLHVLGLESLKNTSALCFSFKCQRKDSKEGKQHHAFRGVLGHWRKAAIDRTSFHACQRCRKTAAAVFTVFSRLWAVNWRGKAFPDQLQQCQFQKIEQRKRIKLLVYFWVRAYRFDSPEAPVASTVGVNSRFSRFQFQHFGRTA